MNRRSLLLGATLALTASAFGPGALAAHVVGPYPAHIHAGVCPMPGDVVAPLTPVVVPAGDMMGVASANVVASSVSSVPLALADIVAGEHSVNVHQSADAMDVYVACGDIGGVMISETDLAIGLAEQNGSRLSGVAWLHDNGDGTTAVSVFLIGASTPPAPAASMAPVESMMPGASMMPEASVAP